MTNRELLIGILSDEDFIDDGGATEESVIHYNIDCPYYSWDERCPCKNDEELTREKCVECKRKWLDQEVDE